MILKGYLLIYFYVFIVAFISHLSKRFKVKTIINRKLTHVMIAFTWLIMYFFLGTTYHLVIVSFTLVLGNYILYKNNLYSLFLSEGTTIGIVYYSVSIFVLALITYMVPDFYIAFGIGILSLGLGDGFAPLVAGYLKSRQLVNNKTVIGSITVFMMTVVVVVGFNLFLSADFSILKIIIIGVMASLIELYCSGKYDNLALPIGLAFIVYLLGVITCI